MVLECGRVLALPLFLLVAGVVEFSAHAFLCLVHAFELSLEFGLKFLARLCELEDVLLGGGELRLEGGASGAVVRDRRLVGWKCREVFVVTCHPCSSLRS